MKDLGQGILHGKVKMIKEYYFGYEYNMKNAEVKYRWKNLPFKGHYKYLFNEKGQLTAIIRFDENDKMSWKNILTYNGKDYWIEQSIYMPGGVSDKTICSLNKQGVRTGHEWYVDIEGEGFFLAEIALYFYDKKGRIKETEYYDTEAKLRKTETDHYDNSGNLVETIECDPDNKIKSRLLDKFDKAGLKTECIIENYEANPRFDHNKIVTKYDNRQNETSTKYYNRKNEIVKEMLFEYIYNDYNNWEEMMVYENGKLVEIIKREIEYFGES